MQNILPELDQKQQSTTTQMLDKLFSGTDDNEMSYYNEGQEDTEQTRKDTEKRWEISDTIEIKSLKYKVSALEETQESLKYKVSALEETLESVQQKTQHEQQQAAEQQREESAKSREQIAVLKQELAAEKKMRQHDQQQAGEQRATSAQLKEQKGELQQKLATETQKKEDVMKLLQRCVEILSPGVTPAADQIHARSPSPSSPPGLNHKSPPFTPPPSQTHLPQHRANHTPAPIWRSGPRSPESHPMSPQDNRCRQYNGSGPPMRYHP